MRVSRIYVSANLKENQQLDLAAKPSHYLLNVLRLKTGAELILFNGDGYDYSAEITATSKKTATVRIHQVSEKEKPARLSIHLGIGLSKGDRFETVLQKATELGVSEVTPLITQFTALRLKPEQQIKKIQHWQGIVQSACEQSGRRYLPVLHEPVPLSSWIVSQQQALKLLLDPAANTPMKDHEAIDDLSLLIGPEGGLSTEEIQQACQHEFKTVRLGKHVLRTETAPLAAISAAQILWGDFS